VKVSWVSSTSREAFVREGKVIVKMQKHQNQARNFLYALMEWTHKGLLPESRHLINDTVLKSVDFAFINKVLSETNRHDSKQLFLDEFYESEAPRGSLIEKYCTAFNKLDSMGIFTGVVLPEYSLLGQRVGSSLPTEEIRAETIGLATMLERLSRKVSGKDVSPNYLGKNIKCSIVLIAKVEKYFEQGLSPYLSFINKCCEQGFSSVYVAGIGTENILIVEQIKDAYERSKKLSFVWEKTQVLKNNESKVLFFRNSLENATSAYSDKTLRNRQRARQNLVGETHVEKETISNDAPISAETTREQGRELLIRATKAAQDEKGFVKGAALGVALRRLDPSFDPKSYGVSKLAEYIELYPDVLELQGRRTATDPTYKSKL
jgi:hypothetical protein